MSAKWNAYSITAIDFEWDNLKTVEDTIKSFSSEIGKLTIASPYFILAEKLNRAKVFVDSWQSAQQAAKLVGWEGDFRQAPVVFWIPQEYEFLYGFVITQDNNGQCFVISPVPLKHLEDGASNVKLNLEI